MSNFGNFQNPWRNTFNADLPKENRRMTQPSTRSLPAHPPSAKVPRHGFDQWILMSNETPQQQSACRRACQRPVYHQNLPRKFMRRGKPWHSGSLHDLLERFLRNFKRLSPQIGRAQPSQVRPSPESLPEPSRTALSTVTISGMTASPVSSIPVA